MTGRAEQFIHRQVEPAGGFVQRTAGLVAHVEQAPEGKGGVLTGLEGVEQTVAGATVAGSGADHRQTVDAAGGDEGQTPLLAIGLEALRHLLAAALGRPARTIKGVAGPADHRHRTAVIGVGDGGGDAIAGAAAEAGGGSLGRSGQQSGGAGGQPCQAKQGRQQALRTGGLGTGRQVQSHGSQQMPQ